MVKFIILTLPRTGSTFLRLWLNNHPNIRCHGEIFLRSYDAKDGFRSFTESKHFYNYLNGLFGNRLFSRIPGNLCLSFLVKRYFDSFYYNRNHSAPWVDMKSWNDYQSRSPDVVDKALGFKVMLSHVEEYHPLQSIIANENYKIIKLSRKNILKSSLSSILMKKRNVAHSVENIEARKVYVDPESLVKQLKKQEKDTLKLNSLFPSNQTMNITYEELFADNDYLFRNILSFIEVSSDNIKKPALKKISPAEIKDIISNYDEVRKVLENRGYEEYLI